MRHRLCSLLPGIYRGACLTLLLIGKSQTIELSVSRSQFQRSVASNSWTAFTFNLAAATRVELLLSTSTPNEFGGDADPWTSDPIDVFVAFGAVNRSNP
eukprot:6176625-Pleurochrysis_carterae.AAC.1